MRDVWVDACCQVTTDEGCVGGCMLSGDHRGGMCGWMHAVR